MKVFLAILASTVIAFVYGTISWSFLPWHQPLDFTDGDAVAEVLKANAPEHGTYALPSWKSGQSDPEAMAKAFEEGPFVWATVRPGTKPGFNMGGLMLGQLLVVALASVTLVFLIQKSKHDAFLDRLSIAVLAGLLLAIMSALPGKIWLETPPNQTLGYFFDGIIPWTLAGAAIAVILPKAEKG